MTREERNERRSEIRASRATQKESGPCEICGTIFVKPRKDAKYCGSECRRVVDQRKQEARAATGYYTGKTRLRRARLAEIEAEARARAALEAARPVPPPSRDWMHCPDRGRKPACNCLHKSGAGGVPCFDLRVIRHACPRLHGRR